MEYKTHLRDRIQVLTLTGRFDAYQLPQIAGWLDSAVKQTPPLIIVNLVGVNFLDSAALAMLVQKMKHCRQQGGELVLCDLQQPVRIIFELTRLDRAFGIYSNEEEAVNSLVK